MSNEAKLQKVERERDVAIASLRAIEREHATTVKATEDARLAFWSHNKLQDQVHADRDAMLFRTLDEASTLLHLVWRESADLFGDRASSHYRSEIGARIEKVTGKRPKP